MNLLVGIDHAFAGTEDPDIARGSGVPRAATGEYGALIGRESAPIAESAGIAESAPRDFVNFTCNNNNS